MKMKMASIYVFSSLIAGCSLFEGPDGKISLVDLSDEPSGQNCSIGGTRISSGIDSNSNGQLDNEEVTSVKYVCNGANGNSGINGQNGLISLIDISSEPIGDNCSNEGMKISSGVDTNENGVLDSNEITSIKYVCNGLNGNDGANGQNGANGVTSLISTSEISPGDLCPNGGIQIGSGLDTNENWILEQSEIESMTSICHGLDGSLYDKQIRLTLPGGGTNGSEVITSEVSNLHKFNIEYYEGLDSVIYTVWSSVPDPGNTNTIDLFNITDNVPIEGSTIVVTSNSTPVLYQSSNVLSGFPKKEIILGLRIKGSVPGNFVNANYGYLYLYKTAE